VNYLIVSSVRRVERCSGFNMRSARMRVNLKMCRQHHKNNIRVDLLLGNGRETNSETSLAASQQILNKQQLNYKSEEWCFFLAVRAEML
jgi:hypothetical protein